MKLLHKHCCMSHKKELRLRQQEGQWQNQNYEGETVGKGATTQVAATKAPVAVASKDGNCCRKDS